MNLLTVFTPAYNRAHTLGRTYESLCRQTCHDFEWLVIDDGSTDATRQLVRSWLNADTLHEASDGFRGTSVDAVWLSIRYIYKENGGLYTGYNTAYANIGTELSVCIDSDDFAPDDLAEKVAAIWSRRPKDKEYCGICGLDFDVRTRQPIGGYFPEGLTEAFLFEVDHRGDTKQAMRTDLMKRVAPMEGFPGEKDFNPVYMLAQVWDEYPMLYSNTNFCWVEYQIGADSMSQGIWRQYVRSPRSFAKLRLLDMTRKHNNGLKRKFRTCCHYVSSCILSRDRHWLKNTPLKCLTILAVPFGVAETILIKYKNRSQA